MKKIIRSKKTTAFASALLVASLALTFSASASLQSSGLSVYIDGKQVEFDVSPIIINDRTMVPMRGIFERLGADISWDDETKTVTAKKDGLVVTLTVGKDEMFVAGKEKALDAPAVIRSGRTLVPLRAVSEALGVAVEWYGDIKTAAITSDEESIKYTELYNLNHEKISVNELFAKDHMDIGWLDSLDGLYKKLYFGSFEADIPLTALEENLDAGWSEKTSPISMTDESFYSQIDDVMKIYWHPKNTSGNQITKYTFDVHYLEKNASGGYKKKIVTVTSPVADGEYLGMTTNIPENCFSEISGMGECEVVIIGNASVRYKGGKTYDFWCGQELTKGEKWSGKVYREDFEPSEQFGKDSVIYEVYGIDGTAAKMTFAEFSEVSAQGYYLTSVDDLYFADGTRLIAAKSKTEALKKQGFAEKAEDVMVQVYDTASGEIEKVLPYLLDTYLAQGKKLYTEPVSAVYDRNGNALYVGSSETQKYISNGYYKTRGEAVITVYSPDGGSLEISKEALAQYISVGWSTEPVMTVYDSAGYGHAIKTAEKESYLANGYFESLDSLYVTLYSTSGESVTVLPFEKPSYTSQGWYEYPVITVYSASGEVAVIATSVLSEYIASGWATSEDDFYRNYYSLTGSVKGLKSDEGAYIAGGWKMMPYPITINDNCRMDRANVWSEYAYKLYWNPVNSSGKKIDNYRVEYYIPDGEEYFENYEHFTNSVEAGERLGVSEFEDYFLVALRPGSDTVIIGEITVEYEDGKIESFWCGQAIKLGAQSWDGTLYNDEFEIVPTVLADGKHMVLPVGK